MTYKAKPRRRRKNLILKPLGLWSLYFSAFIAGLSGSFYLPIVTHIELDFRTIEASMKLGFPLYLTGISLGAIFFGFLSKYLGARRTLILAFCIVAWTSFFCMATSDVDLFNYARFFQGFAAIAGVTLSLKILNGHALGRRTKYGTQIILGLASLGLALGPTLGGVLLHQVKEWRVLFLAMGLEAFAALIAIYWYVPFDRSLRNLFKKRTKETLVSSFSNPMFWLYSFMAGLCFGCFFLYFYLSPFIFEKHYQWSHTEYNLVGVAATVGLAAGCLLERLFLSNWHPKEVLDLGFLCSLLASLAMIALGFFSLLQAPVFLGLTSVVLFGCALAGSASIQAAIAQTRRKTDVSTNLMISLQIGVAALLSSSLLVISSRPLYAALAFTAITIVALAQNALMHHEWAHFWKKPKKVKK